jgi:hypothetical protein
MNGEAVERKQVSEMLNVGSGSVSAVVIELVSPWVHEWS